MEGQSLRRFSSCRWCETAPRARIEGWTLYHVIDEESPLDGLNAGDLEASNVSLYWLVSGYDADDRSDLVRARVAHATTSYPDTTSMSEDVGCFEIARH